MAINTCEALERTLKSCTGCQACQPICQLLGELDDLTPHEIAEQLLIGQVDNKVCHFILRCDLCGLCIRYCPEAINIADIVITARQVLAEKGLSDLQLYRVMWVDQNWNIFTIYRDMYQIDYSDLEKTQCETLFFPGCVLPTYAPELTRAATGWLAEQDKEVGLSLMCCSAPLIQIGAIERAKQYVGRLWQAARDGKARRIVTACPTCFRCLIQGEARGEIEVVSLYQLMSAAGVCASTSGSIYRITVHDSCPDREGSEGKYVRQILSKYEVVEMSHHGASTICCGLGGIVSAIDAGLCVQKAKARLAEFYDTGTDICVTYYMSCALSLSRLAGIGKVRHILELVFNLPLDYKQIQQQSEAIWQGQQDEDNIYRLENSRLQK